MKIIFTVYKHSGYQRSKFDSNINETCLVNGLPRNFDVGPLAVISQLESTLRNVKYTIWTLARSSNIRGHYQRCQLQEMVGYLRHLSQNTPLRIMFCVSICISGG